MRRLILVLCLLGLTLQLPAQQLAQASFMIRYDVDSASTNYCRAQGQGGDPWGPPMQGAAAIKTTGSSTSVTENVVGSNPFTLLSANDVLFVTRPDGTTDVRAINARTDSANVVVDTAVDWSAGFQFRWMKIVCGSTDNDGWISTAGAVNKALAIQFDQGDAGAIEVRFECKQGAPESKPIIISPLVAADCGTFTLASGYCQLTPAGARLAIQDTTPFSACRIGFRRTTDVSDAGTNMEQVTANVSLNRLR